MNTKLATSQIHLKNWATIIQDRKESGLSALVKQKFQLNPFQTGNLFLFCGSSNRKIKGLLWEEDGFLLLYKRLEAGAFQWPRSEAEARDITAEQYRLLMTGYAIEPSVHKVRPKHSM